jgi:hypothetical protein
MSSRPSGLPAVSAFSSGEPSADIGMIAGEPYLIELLWLAISFGPLHSPLALPKAPV